MDVIFSHDEMGFERCTMPDAESNYTLESWYLACKDFASHSAQAPLARQALIKVDMASGGIHSAYTSRAAQTAWARYQADKFCVLVSYVNRCFRRAPSGSRSVALQRLKHIITERSSPSQGDSLESAVNVDYPNDDDDVHVETVDDVEDHVDSAVDIVPYPGTPTDDDSDPMDLENAPNETVEMEDDNDNETRVPSEADAPPDVISPESPSESDADGSECGAVLMAPPVPLDISDDDVPPLEGLDQEIMHQHGTQGPSGALEHLAVVRAQRGARKKGTEKAKAKAKQQPQQKKKKKTTGATAAKAAAKPKADAGGKRAQQAAEAPEAKRANVEHQCGVINLADFAMDRRVKEYKEVMVACQADGPQGCAPTSVGLRIMLQRGSRIAQVYTPDAKAFTQVTHAMLEDKLIYGAAALAQCVEEGYSKTQVEGAKKALRNAIADKTVWPYSKAD